MDDNKYEVGFLNKSKSDTIYFFSVLAVLIVAFFLKYLGHFREYFCLCVPFDISIWGRCAIGFVVWLLNNILLSVCAAKLLQKTVYKRVVAVLLAAFFLSPVSLPYLYEIEGEIIPKNGICLIPFFLFSLFLYLIFRRGYYSFLSVCPALVFALLTCFETPLQKVFYCYFDMFSLLFLLAALLKVFFLKGSSNKKRNTSYHISVRLRYIVLLAIVALLLGFAKICSVFNGKIAMYPVPLFSLEMLIAAAIALPFLLLSAYLLIKLCRRRTDFILFPVLYLVVGIASAFVLKTQLLFQWHSFNCIALLLVLSVAYQMRCDESREIYSCEEQVIKEKPWLVILGLSLVSQFMVFPAYARGILAEFIKECTPFL